MASFESTRTQYVQEHFEVLEIDLPVITGACTVGASDGFGTPLTCDQAWTNEYATYKFTNQNAPILPASNIYRVITTVRENPTELKPGSGLSARGSLSITLNDFIGDPNIGTAGVTTEVETQGTFIGKLNARQIIENKTVRLKLYRVESDGTIDLAGGAETHYYIAESLKSNDNGTWSLQCKDVLSLANLNEKTWPPTAGGFLRQDIDDAPTTLAIPVDETTDYSNVFAVRIGDEFMEVTSVTDNLTATAVLNVFARGSNITAPVSGELLTRTTPDSHSAGDEVFICDLSDDETIDSLLTRILIASDFDAALIPSADWAAEVAEWHPDDKINTLHSEAEDVNDVLVKILTVFLMDLWFDQVDNLAKLSAISVWKQSSAAITEGKEIDAYSLKDNAKDALRASRALVIYDKKNLADNDDVSSYTKASQFSDNQIISGALYKEHKEKLFDSSALIGVNAADLLVQRYVSRFKFTPYNYTWTTQERFLTFKTGDVIDLNSKCIQSASGLPSGDLRAQVTKITPRYGNEGRSYNCHALSYEAAFNDNTEIVLDTPLGGITFYTLAGAPSQAVTVTFILKGTYSFGAVAMKAGSFPAGSKVILILVDQFDGQANGGYGGTGDSIIWEPEDGGNWDIDLPAGNGSMGGIVYDAEGVDTDIYFSGATTSLAYPTADGYIRAPGGGGGGSVSNSVNTSDLTGYGGNSGGGGAGRSVGLGAAGGAAQGSKPINRRVDGIAGQNGDIIGTGGIGGSSAQNPTAGDGGDWGQAGTAGALGGGTGAPAGSGVKDSGATVTFFGDNATRYINGNGDH